MRIYVAGPYSDPDPIQRERNVARALAAGLALLDQGHAPVIPHLAHFFDQWVSRQGRSIPYETYLRWDAALLQVCDGLLYLGTSSWTERELELAVRRRKPVVSRFSRSLSGTDLTRCPQI